MDGGTLEQGIECQPWEDQYYTQWRALQSLACLQLMWSGFGVKANSVCVCNVVSRFTVEVLVRSG